MEPWFEQVETSPTLLIKWEPEAYFPHTWTLSSLLLNSRSWNRTSSVEDSSITLQRNDTDALSHTGETRVLKTAIPPAPFRADTSHIVVLGW